MDAAGTFWGYQDDKIHSNISFWSSSKIKWPIPTLQLTLYCFHLRPIAISPTGMETLPLSMRSWLQNDGFSAQGKKRFSKQLFWMNKCLLYVLTEKWLFPGVDFTDLTIVIHIKLAYEQWFTAKFTGSSSPIRYVLLYCSIPCLNLHMTNKLNWSELN